MKGPFLYGVIYEVINISMLFRMDVSYHWLDNNILPLPEEKHQK
jgi:hypothetical protein